MNPRDLRPRRALVIGKNAVELMDIDEYLRARDWFAPAIAEDVDSAARLLADSGEPFHLVILAAPHANPRAVSLIRFCVDEACPILVIDGASATAQPGRVVLMARPFIDADLDEALMALGLA